MAHGCWQRFYLVAKPLWKNGVYTQNRQISNLKSLIRYSGLAFGIGYFLLFIGLIATYSEVAVRTHAILGLGPLSSLSLSPAPVAVSVFLFLAVICGVLLGTSVIFESNPQDSNASVGNISDSVMYFSLLLLFTGLALALLMSLIPDYLSSYTTLPSGLLSSQWFISSICLIIGAIFLLIGSRILAQGHMESQLTGGVLVFIAVILIYLVAFSPIRGAWSNLISAIGLIGSSSPLLPGPLAAEFNIETVVVLLVAVCAVLYSFPRLRTEKRLDVLRLILSAGGILFGVGLLYFNFTMVSLMSNYVSAASQTLISLWIVFFGFLILGISGIVILIAGIISLTFYIGALSALTTPSQPSARSPVIERLPQSPPMPQKYCRFCGAENKDDAIFCERCGKQIG